MAQYTIYTDFDDEPYETGLTVVELIDTYLPARAAFVRIDWQNPNKPSDLTYVVSADEHDAETIAELAALGGYDDADEFTNDNRVA